MVLGASVVIYRFLGGRLINLWLVKLRIGIHNMFVLIDAWKSTNAWQPISDRCHRLSVLFDSIHAFLGPDRVTVLVLNRGFVLAIADVLLSRTLSARVRTENASFSLLYPKILRLVHALLNLAIVWSMLDVCVNQKRVSNTNFCSRQAPKRIANVLSLIVDNNVVMHLH